MNDFTKEKHGTTNQQLKEYINACVNEKRK